MVFKRNRPTGRELVTTWMTIADATCLYIFPRSSNLRSFIYPLARRKLVLQNDIIVWHYILEPYLLLSNSKKNQWLQNAVGLSQASTSSDGKPKKPVPLKTRENKGLLLPLTPTPLGNQGNLETLTTWPPKLLVSVTATSTAKLQCLYTHPYLVTKNSRFSA